MYRRVTPFINNESLYMAETVQVHTYAHTHRLTCKRTMKS